MSRWKEFRFFPKRMGTFLSIWLIYMIIPIVNLAELPLSRSWYGFVLLVIFLVVYRQSFWQEQLRALYILTGILIISLFIIWYDINYLFMGFYISTLIGYFPRLRTILLFIATLVASILLAVVLHGTGKPSMELLYLIPPFVVMILMPFAQRATLKYREIQKKLSVANEEIERLIKNEERQRIARDLHDTLGHTLSLITLKSELVERLMHKQDTERALNEIQDVKSTSRSALQQVRELVAEMYSVNIQEEMEQAVKILAAAEIQYSMGGIPERLDVSPFAQSVLGMCLRESITNVIKHSQATTCSVMMEQKSTGIELCVKDNGIGMENEQENEPGVTSKSGHGLIGMIERLKLIEGQFDIESLPKQGTKVTIRIPKNVKHQRVVEPA